MTQMPVLFLSHGSPLLAIEPSPARDFMLQLGEKLPRPKAVLVVSAHYETARPAVTAGAAPETIYDFGGFPRQLYEMRYPAPGAPDVARRIAELFREVELPTQLDQKRGLDHGAWVPLSLIYPAHDLPVLQLSLLTSEDPNVHEAVGKVLRPLREEGVLIVGSGSATHNLREYFRPSQKYEVTPDWVSGFQDWLADRIQANDREGLLDYRHHPLGLKNHPTAEHLMPLFVALGAADEEEPGQRLHTSLENYLIGMDAYAWGLA